MANKRDLKKQIRYICGETAMVCLMTRDAYNNIDPQELNQLVVRVADLQTQSLRHVSVAFDKTPRDFDSLNLYHKARKQYYAAAYKKLNDEFNQELQAIVKSLNEAIKK